MAHYKEFAMKRQGLIFGFAILAVTAAFVLVQCRTVAEDGADGTPDYRTVLTAGGGITVPAAATAKEVSFTGVRGLELSKADFGVTGGGAIDRVTVDGDTVTITVTFEAKVYGNPGSHPVLTAGVSTVTVAAGDTEKAAVFFTGAAGLELTTADFSVTGGGAIDRVTMDGDTVTVTITVTFEANMLPSAKVYNVVVASTSSIVRGSANVKIIHLGKDGEAPSLASEIFVSREGSDIQGIGSREYPFATLAYAYTVAADGQYSPIDDTVHAAEFPGLMNQLPFVLY